MGHESVLDPVMSFVVYFMTTLGLYGHLIIIRRLGAIGRCFYLGYFTYGRKEGAMFIYVCCDGANFTSHGQDVARCERQVFEWNWRFIFVLFPGLQGKCFISMVRSFNVVLAPFPRVLFVGVLGEFGYKGERRDISSTMSGLIFGVAFFVTKYEVTRLNLGSMVRRGSIGTIDGYTFFASWCLGCYHDRVIRARAIECATGVFGCPFRSLGRTLLILQ